VESDGAALDKSGEVAERHSATLRLKEGGAFYAPSPLVSIAVRWPKLVGGAKSVQSRRVIPPGVAGLKWKSTHAGLWFRTGSDWDLGIGTAHVAHTGCVSGLGATEALLSRALDAVCGVLTRDELVLVEL